MNNVIEKAKRRLLELESEMNELRSFIRTYEKLSGERVTDVATFAEAAAIPDPPNASGDGYVQDDFSSRDEIVDAARKALKAAYPYPMLIGDLFKEVKRMGIRISGANPKGNLSAKLSPPKDLEYVRNEGWYYRPEKNETSGDKPKAPRFAGGGDTSPNMLNGNSRGPAQLTS